MTLATGLISDADKDLNSEEYWAAVDELRSAGYDVPVWIPEAGSKRVSGDTYDQMPFWAVRQAAEALEVCPEEAFVDRKGKDGTYKGFPGYETYNETLAVIDAAGLNHGREPVTPEETDAEDQDDQDVGSDSASGDAITSQLDQAHLREKNRLLPTKVDRLESNIAEKTDRIESLEAEVECLQRELGTVRSERDRLEAALEDRELDQDSEQQAEGDPTDGRSLLD